MRLMRRMGLMTATVFLLVIQPCTGDVVEDKQEARGLITIADWSWSSGYGVMEASFTITNGSPWSVKDLEIKCTHTGGSGTVIDSNTRTIYEVLPPFSARTFSKLNMGLIHSQSKHSSARILDFEFTGVHRSKETIQAFRDMAKVSEEVNRDLAQQEAARRKTEMAAKTLKYHQDLAAKGDAYGQCQMGLRYLKGDGVEKDEAKGWELLRKAASQDNAEAKRELEKKAERVKN